VASLLFLANGIRHLVSMLHVAGFSTVADFPTDSGGPAADDISAAVIPDVNGVPFLHAGTFSSIRFHWRLYCVGVPVAAFNPGVACCWSHCSCLHS